MTLLHRLVSIVRWMTNRKRAEADLHEELQTFVDMAAAEEIRNGATPTEARRLATLQLGGVEQAKERVRTARHGAWLDAIWRDLHYGLRQVGRNRAFSAIAIATLALGIGVNTAMFSAVDAVLIRPLPYPDAGPSRHDLGRDARHRASEEAHPTPAEWQEWRRHNTVFTDIAATQPATGDSSERRRARRGAGPQSHGESVDRPWRTAADRTRLHAKTRKHEACGSSSSAMGCGSGASAPRRTCWAARSSLNDTSVRSGRRDAAEFYFLPARDIDLWMPADILRRACRRPGLARPALRRPAEARSDARQAREAMAALSLRVIGGTREASTIGGGDALTRGAGRKDVHVAGGAARRLGGGAAHRVRQSGESADVARRRAPPRSGRTGRARRRTRPADHAVSHREPACSPGWVRSPGSALAIPVMRFLETLVPETMAAVHLTLDWRVLAFSAVIALAAGADVWAGPALGGSRPACRQGLREGGRGSAGVRSYWFQHSLIVVETALAVVLLTGGGLLLQTFQQLRQTDLGIRREKLLTFVTPLFRYRDFDAGSRSSTRSWRRSARFPASSAPAAISSIPLTETRSQLDISFLANVAEQVPRQDRAHASRDPRLLRHRRRASARRPVLRHLRPALGRRPWRSSTSRSRIANFRGVRRSGRDSSSGGGARRATGTRLSASCRTFANAAWRRN